MHKISVITDSKLKIDEHLSLTLIFEAKKIMAILLLPPKIVPNRTEYKGGTFGMTPRTTRNIMNKLVAMTFVVKPATARIAAFGLSAKTR
jgi:hypothetical protein